MTETWLDDTVSNSMLLTCAGSTIRYPYSVYRKDRGSRGGGVCIFVHNNMTVSPVSLPSKFTECEVLTLDINQCNSGNMHRLICVYRPPKDNSEQAKTLSDCLNYLCTVPAGGVITLVGDFNLPSVQWEFAACDENGVDDVLIDCFLYNNFTQFVSFPTHTTSGNILDLILCNDVSSILNVLPDVPFLSSVHKSVDFSLFCRKPLEFYGSHEFRDFNNADFVGIGTFLRSLNLENEFEFCASVNECYDIFCEALEAAIAVYVPVKHTKGFSNRKLPRNVRKLRNRKNMLYKNMDKIGGREKYLSANREYCAALREFTEKKERKCIERGDVNRFYKYARSKLKDNSGIAALKTNDDGGLIVDDVEKCEVLNDYFCSVFTVDNGELPAFTRKCDDENTGLSCVTFTRAKVCSAFKKLPNKFSSTPDGIPAALLKRVVTESVKLGLHDCSCLCLPLCSIFTRSFEEGKVPDKWLTANVMPVFKKGLVSDVKNYRPVSLTCISCKLMESIIKEEMIKYLRSHRLISDSQHGFLSKRSVTSQLLGCQNDWTNAQRDCTCVDVLYLDYSKAFDSVSHPKLLLKLECYGITGKLLDWIRSFLANRSQRVTINGKFSCFSCVISGVPQGSVIGPLLFLLFINDIVDMLIPCGVTVKLFADDLKMYVPVSRDPNVISPMVEALSTLENWSSSWQLQLASAKCAVLSIGCGNPKRVYQLQGQNLENVENFRDLGVIISSDLKMTGHCSKIAAQAIRRLGMVFRAFSSRNVRTLLHALHNICTSFARVMHCGMVTWGSQ